MTSDSSSPTPARPETSVLSEPGEAGPCRERFENLPLADVVSGSPTPGRGLGLTGDPEADIWGEGSTKLLLGDMAGDWKVVYKQKHTKAHEICGSSFFLFGCAGRLGPLAGYV